MLSAAVFAQFAAGTVVRLSSDVHSLVVVAPRDVPAAILDYSASLTILKGTTIAIRRAGGYIDNLEFSKGKASVNESFRIGADRVERELTWLNGVPGVTMCTVNGERGNGMVKVGEAGSLNLTDPVLAPRLKPHSGARYFLTLLAIAILGCVVMGWLMVRRSRRV